MKIWKVTPPDAGQEERSGGLVEEKTLVGHNYCVNSVQFSPGGTLLASASTDGTTILWDARAGTRLASLVQPSGAAVRTARFCPGSSILASAGDGEEVCLWDLSTGNLARTIKDHEATVFAIAFSPDGDILISTDALGRCKVWSSLVGHNQLLTGVEEAHDLGVNDVCFSPDVVQTALVTEYRVVTCGNDGYVCTWRLRVGSENKMTRLQSRAAHEGAAMTVAVSAAGDRVATAGGDKLVKVWTPELEPALCQVLESHSRYVTTLAFSSCGHFLASGSNDKSVKVWSDTGDYRQTSLSLHNTAPSRAENLYQVQLSRTERRPLQVLSGHTADVTSCDMCDGKLASGCNDALVRVWGWQQASGRYQEADCSPLVGHKYAVYCVRFCGRGGARLMSAGLDGVIILWDVVAGAALLRLQHSASTAFRVVAVAGAGVKLAAGSDDNKIHVWDLEREPRLEARLAWHDNTVLALHCSQDSRFLAAGCSGGALSIWRLGGSEVPGPVVATNDGHDLGVTGCQWRADLALLTSGNDGDIKVWRFSPARRSLECEAVTRAHATSIMTLRLVAGEAALVTSSGDKTVKVWRVCAGAGSCALLATLGPHSSYVPAAAADRGVLAAAADSAIVLYSLPPLDLTAAAPHPPPSVAPADISIWSPVDVRHWLKTLPFFDSVENLYDVDGATLLKLNAKDITSLGVKEDIAERIVDEIKLICDNNKEIPNEFICPITCDLMANPVECSDGFVYEESAIKV